VDPPLSGWGRLSLCFFCLFFKKNIQLIVLRCIIYVTCTIGCVGLRTSLSAFFTVLIPTGTLADCDRVRVLPTSIRGRACDTTIALCFISPYIYICLNFSVRLTKLRAWMIPTGLDRMLLMPRTYRFTAMSRRCPCDAYFCSGTVGGCSFCKV